MVLFTSQHWRVYLQAAKTPPDVYFSIAQLNPLVAQPPATNRSTLVPLTVSLFPSKTPDSMRCASLRLLALSVWKPVLMEVLTIYMAR
jgi:hypothetical protein